MIGIFLAIRSLFFFIDNSFILYLLRLVPGICFVCYAPAVAESWFMMFLRTNCKRIRCCLSPDVPFLGLKFGSSPPSWLVELLNVAKPVNIFRLSLLLVWLSFGLDIMFAAPESKFQMACGVTWLSSWTSSSSLSLSMSSGFRSGESWPRSPLAWKVLLKLPTSVAGRNGLSCFLPPPVLISKLRPFLVLLLIFIAVC